MEDGLCAALTAFMVLHRREHTHKHTCNYNKQAVSGSPSHWR